MMPSNLDADGSNVQNNYCGDPELVPVVKKCSDDYLNKEKL